jgi:UrcA family protein
MSTLYRTAAAAFAALVLLPVAAHAGEGEVSKRTTVVSYADLDPSREADARVLLRRLGHASARVCRGDERVETTATRRCREAAVADAVRSIRAPLLSRLHDRGARPTATANL